MRLIDLTGNTYGRLTVVRRFEKNDSTNKPQWVAQCSCGSGEAIYSGCHLRDGHTQSCGCLIVEGIIQRSFTHGRTHSTEYKIWCSMHTRCSNPKAVSYRYYGARGIYICERWASFENFFADMGPRPANTSLDRIDSNGPYSPRNCRWASLKEQNRNRRNTRKLIVQGESISLPEAAERLGVHANTLHSRLWRGWSIERAVTQPVRGRQ